MKPEPKRNFPKMTQKLFTNTEADFCEYAVVTSYLTPKLYICTWGQPKLVYGNVPTKLKLQFIWSEWIIGHYGQQVTNLYLQHARKNSSISSTSGKGGTGCWWPADPLLSIAGGRHHFCTFCTRADMWVWKASYYILQEHKWSSSSPTSCLYLKFDIRELIDKCQLWPIQRNTMGLNLQ